MFRIEIDSAAVISGLEALARRCQQRQPLMRHISMIMEAGVQDNFRAGGRPSWLGVKRGGKPLTDTGHLKNSITTVSDNDSATVGTNVEYAAIHHFGGTTRPHVIRPRHKKALAFGGRVFKKVNHPGSKIPARPFLTLTPSEYAEIDNAIQQYFKTL